MSNILKVFKGHIGVVLIIALLTVVQVYCDLALPQYTSDLVDIGIQQGGIEDAVPDYISGETMGYLLLFMDEKETAAVEKNYLSLAEAYEAADSHAKDGNGKSESSDEVPVVTAVNEDEGSLTVKDGSGQEVTIEYDRSLAEGLKDGEDLYIYTGLADESEREDLNEAIKLPMAVVYMAGQNEEFDLEKVKLTVDAGLLSREQLLDEINEEMGNYSAGDDYSESLLEQAAIAEVSAEYEKLGVDTRSIQMKYLWHEGIEMLLLTVVMVGVAILAGFFASRTGAQIGRDTRRKVFTKVVSFSNAEMDRFSTASLITRCTNDVQQVQNVSVMMLRIVMMAPIMGAGAIIKVVATHTGMGWITVVAVLMMLVLIGLLMMIAMPKFRIMQKLIDRMNLVSREIISGIPVIRAFSRERFEEERFNGASQDLRKTQIFTQRTMAFMFPVMMIIMNLISVGVVWFGAHGVDLGNLQVGDMMAFITYTIQVVMSFMMLSVAAIIVPRAAVAAGRIEEVLSTEVTIADCDQPEEISAESARGRVCFDHVSFRYPEAEEDVLEDISFTAEPGQTTAIIGSTGCGKTTLVDLIPRFHDVTEGSVTVDGKDVRRLRLAELRSLIGYVPQKGVLFSGDIRSNIKFASSSISDEEMTEAAETAQALDFIKEQESGFAAPIAQGGTNVSGGQKQRLSIARAIAKHPRIYIFDDSFSALDYKTDARLRHDLAERTGDATVIIVAQRIATILHADKIIVLEEGRMAGCGTHSELYSSCRVYREIAESQLSAEELGKEVQ